MSTSTGIVLAIAVLVVAALTPLGRQLFQEIGTALFGGLVFVALLFLLTKCSESRRAAPRYPTAAPSTSF